jgi:acetolactate synthase-1/2/3 large subunit
MTQTVKQAEEQIGDGIYIDTTGGARLFIEKAGSGSELVVFIHAVGGDHRSWRPQMKEFSRRFTCLALDLRGHGKSSSRRGLASKGSSPEKTELSCEQAVKTDISVRCFASDVLEVIKHCGFQKAHIVGLSMGGLVALETFRQSPNMVQSLTVANSFCYLTDGEARRKFMHDQLAQKSLPESSREVIPNFFAKGTDPAVIEESIQVEGSKNREVFLASWDDMLQCDYRELIPAIDVPLLLIGGSEDKTTPPDPLLRYIYDNNATACFVIIEGANHFSNLDHPDEFNHHLAIHLIRAARETPSSLSAPLPSNKVQVDADTTAQFLMRILNERGFEYFFSNSGTDFTPIIDALARYSDDPSFRIKTVLVPHENTAIAMAHGYFLATGKTPVVMAHVNVGTANMGLGLINASRSRIPMLVLAGRTPWHESEVDGCRTNFVQWGQESFDQGAYFREFTKWDYELKGAFNLETVVDRAIAISKSQPAGPVYLTLPKEPLSEQLEKPPLISASPRQKPTASLLSDPQAIEQAAKLISQAERPVIVTAEVGRYKGGPEALVQLAELFALPVVEHGKRNFFNFPTEHVMHMGFNPAPNVESADLLVVVESHVPWIPSYSSLKQVPNVIQIGVDPLCSNIPMRSFPVDVNVAGNPASSLRSLCQSLRELSQLSEVKEKIRQRRERIRVEHERLYLGARAAADADAKQSAITKTYLSYCLGQAIDDETLIFNEYNLDPFLVPRRVPGTWFENSIASGLGWALGAALGAKLGNPGSTIVATIGDGSYLFNTPLSAHFVAASASLPILIIVFNDSAWSTIKKSCLGSNPDGWAVKKDAFPLCDFDINVAFEKLAEACGGIGRAVSEPKALPDVIRQCLKEIREGDKHVLLNVICKRDA